MKSVRALLEKYEELVESKMEKIWRIIYDQKRITVQPEIDHNTGKQMVGDVKTCKMLLGEIPKSQLGHLRINFVASNKEPKGGDYKAVGGGWDAEGRILAKQDNMREDFSSLHESIADEIAKQLGGTGRLKMMIGAKNFASDNGGKTLRFEFPVQKKSNPNMIKITLNGKDLYDIEFGRKGMEADKEKAAAYKEFGLKPPRMPTYKKMKTYDDVYFDQLMDIFEKETGLYLTLNPRK